MNNHTDNGQELGLLTVPEAAKLLRISRNLAYELVARNEIPVVRLGRVIRVPRRGLSEWLDREIESHPNRSTQAPGAGSP